MRMLRKLFLMLRVRNNLNKMASLMFALRFFDVSGFLEVV